MAWEDAQALALYQDCERLGGQAGWQDGWERLMQFKTLRLSERDAELLYLRLAWLAEHVPTMRQEFWGA